MPFPDVNPALRRALDSQGYLEPTPVQAAILEGAAAGRDLLVSAQTGSGKTVAYGLAMAADLLGTGESLAPAAEPLALVIAPTRELALQVQRELAWLYAPAGARIVACVGGMDARREQRLLEGGVHMVVGTPGRLKDHLERGNLDLSALKVLVLDEADEMLDLGFREDLDFLIEAVPPKRRTLMFSATIAKEIGALARRYQSDAHRIDTTARNAPHGDIEYRAMRIAPGEVEHAVVNVLRFFESPGALVFCGTREAVRHMFTALRERGFSVVHLSGELSQKERTDALQALRDGSARVCVATDVAARGLDLPDLGLVIHAELPANRQGLLHRSGRTGRAGRKGVSVLLTPYTKRRRVEQLLASADIVAVWSGPPSAEAIRAGDQKRLLEDPILTDPPAEDEAALVAALLEGSTPERIAAALIRMHRARLPAAEEVFDDAGAGAAGGGADMTPAWRPQDSAPRTDRLGADEVDWFRLTVGRQNNADPKWLVPLICRLGHVTKRDIGQIRIFDRETKFGISKAVVVRFSQAIREASADDVRIEPAAAPPDSRQGEGGRPRAAGPPPKRTGPPTHRKGPPPFKRGKPKPRADNGAKRR